MAAEIDSLKSTRKTLEIALAALGGAFLLALGGLVFGALRNKKKHGSDGRMLVPTADMDADEFSLNEAGTKVRSGFGPRSAPKGGRRSSNRGSISSRVTAVEFDADRDEAFLPPIKSGKGESYSMAAVPASPRASMETLKGYSDPYDPPSGVTPRMGGSATLRPESAAAGARSPSPTGTARPGSASGRYADGGQEYRD